MCFMWLLVCIWSWFWVYDSIPNVWYLKLWPSKMLHKILILWSSKFGKDQFLYISATQKFTECVYILSLKRSLAVKTLSLCEHSNFQMNYIRVYLFLYHQVLFGKSWPTGNLGAEQIFPLVSIPVLFLPLKIHSQGSGKTCLLIWT